MFKNKLLLITLLFFASQLSVFSENLSDLEYPKPPAYRVGISEIPENQYIQAKQQKPKVEKTYAQIDDSRESSIMDVTYADLSIKRLSKEISQELEFEQQDMVADLSLLWQGAAVRSDTINFALYKLANPDADKPDSKSIKNVLKTIASMSTLVGASMGSPIIAGSSLIGGNILGIMSQDTKELNYKYTRVTDADMIILIRKIEDLQQNAVNLYYDYMSAKKQLELTTKLVEERQRKFELAQQNNAPRELVVITDAYYRTAIDKQRNAKSEFFAKRAALEQFVGNEAFVQFEADLTARENGEKPAVRQTAESAVSEPAYSDTVKNVETYTDNLKKNESSENKRVDMQTEENLDANLDKVPELKPLDEQYDKKSNVVEESPSNEEKTADSVQESKKQIQKKSLKEKFFSVKSKKQNKESKETSENRQESISDSDVSLMPDVDVNTNTKGKEDDKKSEKVVSKKKSKADKYSTKGLIFLHNKTQENSSKDSSLQPLEPIIPQSASSDAENELKKLPPLDEIKAPELDGHGYSIHSDEDLVY